MTLSVDSCSASRLVAIEIGGTKLQLAVCTRANVILERSCFTVDSERGAEGIRECKRRIVKSYGKSPPPRSRLKLRKREL